MEMRENLKSLVAYKPGVLKEGALKLSSNENRLGASPKAIEAISQSLKSVSIYPDGSCRLLKEALAEKLGYKKENFIIGNGSDELMAMIAATYLSKGDRTIVSECTFSEYTFATVLYSGEVQKVPLKEGTYDTQKVLKAIDEKTKIIYCCNPNNPTGTYISHGSLDNMLEKVPKETLFVLDEAYGDYSDAPDFPDAKKLLTKYSNLMVLRTFSKIYGLAAMRIGYGIAREEVINQVLVTKQPFNVNTPAQMGAIVALNDDEFYEKSRAMNRQGKKFLYGELDRLGLTYYRSQANFICIGVKRDEQKLFRDIMGQGITIRPLTSFGLAEWIRVTIGSERDNKLFIKILEKTLI